MSARSKIQLSRLRDIGWSLWDPIGLQISERSWKDNPAADEYDGYLLNVAGLLRRGGTEAKCADYLVRIEAEHMGMGTRAEER